MLRDYETMLKNQSSRLSELDAEREELHVHNTELEARVRDLEMRLEKVTSARDRLNERVEELTATLQGEGETIVTCRMEVHLPAFLYCKRQKAGRGLGTRLRAYSVAKKN